MSEHLGLSRIFYGVRVAHHISVFCFVLFWFLLRDRPFNLKRGGYGFWFRSEKKFRTTRELEYLFFCRAKREIFFQISTLDYMTKTLNQIIFFFLHQNQNIFFSNIGNQNIFLGKKHNPPPFKLNGRSLMFSFFCFCFCFCFCFFSVFLGCYLFCFCLCLFSRSVSCTQCHSCL